MTNLHVLVAKRLKTIAGLVGQRLEDLDAVDLVDQLSKYGDAFLSKRQITPVPNSRLVEVGFQSADPELAARAANELADAYVELSREVQLQSTAQTLTWLADETAKQKAKVEASEHRLAETRSCREIWSQYDLGLRRRAG